MNDTTTSSTPAPAPRQGKGRKVLIGVGVIAVLAVIGSVMNGTDNSSSSSSASTGSSSPAPEEPAPARAYVTPQVSDFYVHLKITRQECGSAGCNVSYEPNLGTTLSPGQLDPSVTYSVTYRINGGEEPQIETLTITGDDVSSTPGMISTPPSTTALSTTVTDVSVA
jgi:hypothetical protein